MIRIVHVSSVGSGDSAGSPDAPVATIAEALRRVTSSGCREIVLADETHYLDKTLALGPQHGGSIEDPVVIRGANGTRPVISGARRVECSWQEVAPRSTGGSTEPDDVAAGHQALPRMLMCDLSNHADIVRAVDQMYVDGRRQVKARYPNGDSRNPDRGAYVSVTRADDFPHSEVYFDSCGIGEKRWTQAGLPASTPIRGSL